MTASVIIAVLTALAMILSVLFKPYITVLKTKLGLYVIICFTGAVAELLFGGLDAYTALNGITANTAVNPLKILALFLSMTLISVYLGDSGFFRLVAERAFSSANGRHKKARLFITLYIIVSALTVFTSNDIVILTFTPIICLFCKKAGYPPIPFLIGEFVAANTWSMALIVGNPTNVYLAQSAGVSFFEYFKVMALPAIAAGLSSLAVLFILFRKTLFSDSAPKQTVNSQNDVNYSAPALNSTETNFTLMTAALTALIGCIVALAVSDLIDVEMWAITVIFAGALFIFNIIYGLTVKKGFKIALKGIKKTPWELAPFILSMFVIVLALENDGATARLTSLLVLKRDTDGVTFGYLSAGFSNLLNNIPTSVITEKIISGQSIAAAYGAVIGTNIGAFITPVGALAGIMWNKILSDYGIKLPFYKFALYGITVAAVSLSLSLLTLYLVF